MSMTPLENQLLAFFQTPIMEFDPNQAAALIGSQLVTEDQQPASAPHLRRYFLNELGQQQRDIAAQKWQALQQQQTPPQQQQQQTSQMPPMLGDAGLHPPVASPSQMPPIDNPTVGGQQVPPTPQITQGTTTQPGQQNTQQQSLPEVQTGGVDVPVVTELMGFPIFKTETRKAKGRKVGEHIYPFDSDEFLIGQEFVVHAESNSEEDLKAIRKTLKSAANAANRRNREKTGDKEMVTRKVPKMDGKVPVVTKCPKTGKSIPVKVDGQVEVDVMRQTKKFTTEALEPVGDQLGGVRVLRVAIDD